MKQDKMRNCIILVGLFITEVHCQFSSLQLFESTSGCFGIASDETKMNATCEAGHSVAINNVTMGAKPASLDCPWIFNTSFDFNTCCTYDENDCLFPFFETNDQYHSLCNGKSSCTPQTQIQNIPASCSSQNETYGAEGLSHYMFMDFYCIQDDKMVDMCSGTNSPLTVENTEVYIWNRDFSNSEIGPGDSGCNCSIEIDNCDSEINIYTLYRKLTGDEDGMCNQSLRIFVGENSGDGLDWSCSDNNLEFETNTVAETYIYINLENRRTSTGGKFWLGFGATMDSNITASCPPRSQEHCLLSTTTQVTSATVAESTTTETPTNTTSTDVTSSTTEMTTDTTTTTSVTSTTLLSTTTETTPAETTIDETTTTTETIASATKDENVHCQFSSLQLFQSSSGCFGIKSDETTINATCEAGHSVAINNVTMGAKPTSLDCPWIFNTSFDFNTCCTYDENDCLFPFFETNDQYHSLCNGKSSCTPQTQNQNIPASCSSQNETYGAEGLSHYTFMDFYCIQDDKMVDMCSGTNSPLTIENTEVYIWNRDFSNSEIGPGDSGCNCSIEIDNCDSEINIYTIYRKLTGDEDGMCNQSLRIFVGENSGDGLDWSCSDNKLEFETNTVAETYIYINLENRRTSTGGKFWLGFGATMDSNITASCPPRSQEHCLLSKTTEVTSTTVAGSTTTETPTNTTSTDVTSSTTEMTTDTTTTTSVTSTTALSTTTETTPAETTIDDTSTTTIVAATKDENDTDLLVAVIVIAILVSGLAIAVVVLSCCLFNIRRHAKTEDYTEKVISNNYQASSPDLASNIFAVSNTPIPSKDSGCLVKFVPQTTDFSCQVESPRGLINVQSLSPQRVKMFDRGTNTVTPFTEETSTITSRKSDKMCQTTDVKRKDQNIQINLNFSSPMKTVSCQTEETSNEQTQPQKTPPVTNEVIPALREADDSPRKSEENMQDTDGNERKSRCQKRKKSRKNIPECVNDEMSDSWLDRSTKSPANLDSIQPEFMENRVLLSTVDQNDDNYASDEVADTDIPIKIHTKHVSFDFF